MTDEQFRSQAADRLIEQVVNGRMTRRQLLLRASVLGFSATAIGGLLAACGSPSSQSGATSTSASTSAPQYGGTYNYPLDGDPVGITPNTYQESIGYNVVRQIFEGLMTYRLASDGVTMDTVPALCTDYEVSPDAKVFTFTIRQGVYFQPPVNTEVTAADFVASWNAVADPKSWIPGTPAYILAPIVGTDATGAARHGLTGVRALGKWTLQVTLKDPFAEFPASLGHPILSVWPVAYATKETLARFEQKPVGTGPYQLRVAGSRPRDRLGAKPPLVGRQRDQRPLRRRHPHARVHRSLDRVARLPGRQHRLQHGAGRSGAVVREARSSEGLGRQDVAPARR